ncbi:hypothetical protein ATB98_27265 [Sinorhizobium saheli]|uniref:Uncharacterized protein n=1 Tax=Sinorhizobium saheli TaxID=36856 RepID=A0A178YNN4_SINSA|nr:hypothetical protein ATB98_27265 [Sinorhizobium saheli]
MSIDNYYQAATQVVRISTDIVTGCKHCGERIDGEQHFAEAINHYIDAHEYKLLHVGAETTRSSEGDLWHSTVAILGK